jgi:type 1 glutamine amidotransferase
MLLEIARRVGKVFGKGCQMRSPNGALALAAVLCACSGSAPKFQGSRRVNNAGFSVLIFSKTAGFRHASIPNGIAAIGELGSANGFSVDATEDSNRFNAVDLAGYRAVIFLSTTGTVLNAEQKSAFERYIGSGNGFVGIHSATDTEYDWGWYGQLVGAYFRSHPAIQPATIQIEDPDHPSTSPLPVTWDRTDEWYNFRTNPRGSVRVLATMDESSYSGGDMGDHPMVWCHDVTGGGRSWYTAFGHTEASYDEPLFREHLLGGILSAAGAVPANCAVAP